MTGLRLTVGIPTTGARPERLDVAIGSALAQTVPVRVLVSAQGDSVALKECAERYAANPLVRFVESPATCLWENWSFAAESCDTELFAWLQDDDFIAPHFARRVTTAFDACPRASTYLARLGISYAGDLACWWQATGPMVPMDLLRGGFGAMSAAVMSAGAYFSSHALSPGVAFRWSVEACRAVRRVPKDADLFAERSVLAELSQLGPAVCDPAIVGYWVHHEGNESRAQNSRGDGDRQYRVMLSHIDPIVSAIPGWREAVRGWSLIVGQQTSEAWYAQAGRFRGESPVLDEALSVLEAVHPQLKAEAPPARAVEPETATGRKSRRAERATARA